MAAMTIPVTQTYRILWWRVLRRERLGKRIWLYPSKHSVVEVELIQQHISYFVHISPGLGSQGTCKRCSERGPENPQTFEAPWCPDFNYMRCGFVISFKITTFATHSTQEPMMENLQILHPTAFMIDMGEMRVGTFISSRIERTKPFLWKWLEWKRLWCHPPVTTNELSMYGLFYIYLHGWRLLLKTPTEVFFGLEVWDFKMSWPKSRTAWKFSGSITNT